jgi:hypothetical protein
MRKGGVSMSDLMTFRGSLTRDRYVKEVHKRNFIVGNDGIWYSVVCTKDTRGGIFYTITDERGILKTKIRISQTLAKAIANTILYDEFNLEDKKIE